MRFHVIFYADSSNTITLCIIFALTSLNTEAIRSRKSTTGGMVIKKNMSVHYRYFNLDNDDQLKVLFIVPLDTYSLAVGAAYFLIGNKLD